MLLYRVSTPAVAAFHYAVGSWMHAKTSNHPLASSVVGFEEPTRTHNTRHQSLVQEGENRSECMLCGLSRTCSLSTKHCAMDDMAVANAPSTPKGVSKWYRFLVNLNGTASLVSSNPFELYSGRNSELHLWQDKTRQDHRQTYQIDGRMHVAASTSKDMDTNRWRVMQRGEHVACCTLKFGHWTCQI